MDIRPFLAYAAFALAATHTAAVAADDGLAAAADVLALRLQTEYGIATVGIPEASFTAQGVGMRLNVPLQGHRVFFLEYRRFVPSLSLPFMRQAWEFSLGGTKPVFGSADFALGIDGGIAFLSAPPTPLAHRPAMFTLFAGTTLIVARWLALTLRGSLGYGCAEWRDRSRGQRETVAGSLSLFAGLNV